MVDFKQIDRAYVQYMVSSDILVHLIPVGLFGALLLFEYHYRHIVSYIDAYLDVAILTAKIMIAP